MKEIIKSTLQVVWRYLLFLKQRVINDRITVNAGYMAYISILSIVPLVTVLFSILSYFPVFSGVGENVQSFVIQNFLPAAGDAVEASLKEFIGNTARMTAVGSAFLFIISITLISSIDNTLNSIWRVTKKRSGFYSFSLYWMILTLGPVLLGASLVITSYLISLNLINDDIVSGFLHFLLRWLPAMLSFAGFVGLYLFVPNKKVQVIHAITGAFSASILFELSKIGFTRYITQFPSYEIIYGALSTIPILFVWVYLCWVIVLLGAEVTVSLDEFKENTLMPPESEKE